MIVYKCDRCGKCIPPLEPELKLCPFCGGEAEIKCDICEKLMNEPVGNLSITNGLTISNTVLYSERLKKVERLAMENMIRRVRENESDY